MGKTEPLRKCVSCNEMKEKKDLIRVIRTKEGEIRIDEKGKASGRGAYLCRDRKCIEDALKKKRLETALSIQIPDEIKERLRESGEDHGE
ncbi:MAG: YlxR family protein [Lachnospiraceae bacterium]|nr:YlxR family protein [Lachnospiraceae bacterium]